MGPHLEDFLANVFGVEPEVRALEEAHHELAPLYAVKRLFVQRKAMNAHKADVAATFDGAALHREIESLLGESFTELAFAKAVTRWQQDETKNASALDVAMRYAAWAAHTAAGHAAHKGGVLFRAPRKLDYLKLVPLQSTQVSGVDAWTLAGDHKRERDGFALTDSGMELTAALGEAHYCIWCHEQGKDSCARGLPEKKSADGERARFRSAGARSASSSPGVRWKRRSRSSRSCARKAGPSPRLRSCAWTTRWSPPPGIGSATTA